MPAPDSVQLRRCVLAVSVTTDLDVEPGTAGVVVPGPRPAEIGWADIAETVAGLDLEGGQARHRVEMLLRLHQLVADLGTDARSRLLSSSRLMALPAGHWDHLGPGWVVEGLRGQALDLGIGVFGLIGEADRVTPLPPSVLRAVGMSPAAWWERVREHADRMGALAAARLGRDGITGVVRPVGGCDVLALLSSRTLRRHLADGDGTGMRSLAVPTRRRGWFDIQRIDPAFVQAAWMLTDEPERGCAVPLLVTADEVALPIQV
jgi:hypothetical protein